MGQHFTDPERWAKEFDDPSRDAWQMPEKVIAALGLKAGESVADIGAGTGYFSVRLASSATRPQVYAVDIEPAMVAHLKRRAAEAGLDNLSPIQAGVDRPNLPGPVDVVLVVNTYHHIPDRAAYFTRVKQSMKPGGRLAIIDFRTDAPDGPPAEFRFSDAQISSELASAGFALAARHDFLPRQLLLVYTRD